MCVYADARGGPRLRQEQHPGRAGLGGVPPVGGGAVRAVRGGDGAAAQPVALAPPVPRGQRHQRAEHGDVQGGHAGGHRIHLPGWPNQIL